MSFEMALPIFNVALGNVLLSAVPSLPARQQRQAGRSARSGARIWRMTTEQNLGIVWRLGKLRAQA